jgi:hypothetical protein
MSLDGSFIERNCASTNRMRALPVGRRWTVSATLVHLAFWDLRVLHLLDATERNGRLSAPEIDVAINDIALPLWMAIQPRTAARIAVETAEALDKRLADFPPPLLENIFATYERWVIRALHRNAHLDSIDAALKR